MAFDISDSGKIIWNSDEYIIPKNDITNLANTYLREKSEIVVNSMLSKTMKNEVLGL